MIDDWRLKRPVILFNFKLPRESPIFVNQQSTINNNKSKVINNKS